MKYTYYFELRLKDRPELQRAWCERVVADHIEERQQADGKFQMWGYVPEVERYLRVVTLEDRETIDNAFFDRSYERRKVRQ